MRSLPHVACLYLAPWSLTLLARQHPGVPVAVLSEARRVTEVTPQAAEAGVRPGMAEGVALSRCPELHTEVVPAPAAAAAWNELLETLYARFSDRVAGRVPGVAYLHIDPAAARELAVSLHAPVGLAASQEVALLAALRTRPGEVKVVSGAAGGDAEKVFVQLTPLRDLWALGIGTQDTEALQFLGISRLAELWTWSAAQREHFLGVDGHRQLARFLRGERTTTVERYQPGQWIERTLALDFPLTEPAQLEAALTDLIPPLWAELRGRKAGYLTVHADTALGQHSATRQLKWPLEASGLGRLALRSLLSTQALAVGIDALSVQLSGLQQPGRMVGLWSGLADLEVTRQILERYPRSLVKVRWLDPFAYVTDARYEWVEWGSGALKASEMTPAVPAPQRPQAKKAAQHHLAFFEGAP